MPVRQRLELGGEHVALLLVEVELVDPLGDRLRVESRELVAGQERIVGKRERLLDAVHEPVPPALGDLVSPRDRAGAPLVSHEPAGDLRVSAELDVGVVPAVRPRAPAEAITRLEEERRASAQSGLSRRSYAREATPDDD